MSPLKPQRMTRKRKYSFDYKILTNVESSFVTSNAVESSFIYLTVHKWLGDNILHQPKTLADGTKVLIIHIHIIQQQQQAQHNCI